MSGWLKRKCRSSIRAKEFKYHGDLMNLGFPEMVFLFILGLLLFGPKRLPELGRQLGKFMGDFRRASQEFQSQLHEEVQKLEDEVENSSPRTIAPPRPEFTAARNESLEGENKVAEPNSGQHPGNEPDPAPLTKEPNA